MGESFNILQYCTLRERGLMNFDSQYRSVVVRGWVVVTRKPRWFTKDEQSIIDRSLRNKWCYPSRSGCENLRHFVLGEGVVVQVLEHFTRRETGGWIYGVNVLYLEVRTACLSAADPLRIERKWKERMKKKKKEWGRHRAAINCDKGERTQQVGTYGDDLRRYERHRQ